MSRRLFKLTGSFSGEIGLFWDYIHRVVGKIVKQRINRDLGFFCEIILDQLVS